MIVAASVVMFDPSDREPPGPTAHVPPVSVPDERLVGGAAIVTEPLPSLAVTVPAKVLVPLN